MRPAFQHAVQLLYRGDLREARCFDAGTIVTVGEQPSCDFVVPGLGPSQVIIGAHGLQDVEGLLWTQRGNQVSFRSVDYPDIELVIATSSRVPNPSGLRRPWIPSRELLYGFALAGCLASLFGARAVAAPLQWHAHDRAQMERVMLEVPIARSAVELPRLEARPRSEALDPDTGSVAAAGTGLGAGAAAVIDGFEPIGVSACDTLLATFVACLPKMVPYHEEQREELRKNLAEAAAQWREIAKSPTAREALEEACSQATEMMGPQLEQLGC